MNLGQRECLEPTGRTLRSSKDRPSRPDRDPNGCEPARSMACRGHALAHSCLCDELTLEGWGRI